MNLHDAQSLAIKLMSEHGLIAKGWCFEFDNAKIRFGRCSYRIKKITLSEELTMLNAIEQVKDVILHEIAHALAGHKAGHGEEWKKVCVQIGAKPERCYKIVDTVRPQGKYMATCNTCETVHYAHKKTILERSRSCPVCDKKFNPKHLLTFKLNPNFVPEKPKWLR